MSNAFLDAINFAEARKVVLPSEFYAADLKSRQLATTVSLLSSIEQMKTVIDSVNKAIRSGLTFADFQKEVKANGINLSSSYLDLVFRQNVQTAYSHGRWLQQQRNKHNRPYLRYSAINDNRTRPSHSALNGIIRHIDDPFWLVHYPPWAFRCFLPDVKIEGGSQGAIQRFYTGEVVDIFTKSGRKVSLTTNHPILTSRGWVCAGSITNTDNLLGYDRPIKPIHINRCSREIDNNQGIPSSEYLFKAFILYALTFGETSSLKLDSNLLVDNCKINIDVTDSCLNLSIYTKSGKRVFQSTFVDRNNRRDRFFEGLSSSDFGFSDIDLMLSKNTGNITARCIKDGGNFLLSDVLCFIGINHRKFEINISVPGGIPCISTLSLNSTKSLFDLFPLKKFGLASTSQDDTLFEKLSFDGISSDLGLFRYLINAHSERVFIDPVINIAKRSYSGHVYDFQSDNGLLSANGIIAHNCRCSVIALTEEKAQQLGITPDNAVPQGPQQSAFSTTPWAYSDLTELVHQKIIESGFDPRLFDEPLQQMKAEAVAVKKLTEVLTVSDQATDDLFSKVSKVAMPKSADIRPSTVKMLIDYAQGKATQLTGYLKSGVMSLADKLLSRWVGNGLAQVKKIAQNVSHVVQGKISLELASSLALGQVLRLDSPLLINNLGDVSVRIENAKDYGIDLEQLQAGQGVLFEMGLSLKVVAVEQNDGQTVYVLKFE